MIKIAPSLLSADFANLSHDIDVVTKAGAHALHIDVMDGHYVPNITIGPPVIKAIRRITSLPLDVHLMIEKPERFITEFVDAGADQLCVHVEACPHIHRTLGKIREAGAKAGVSLNPGTALGTISEILHLADFVLIMSVNPGFGGQAFIPESINKIQRLANVIQSRQANTFISVDGGVCENNVTQLVAAGASLLVAGSSIFGAPDPAGALKNLISTANSAKNA
ncbi:MAG: ribulose-phosphate 3-epimerase [bacterium]